MDPGVHLRPDDHRDTAVPRRTGRFPGEPDRRVRHPEPAREPGPQPSQCHNAPVISRIYPYQCHIATVPAAPPPLPGRRIQGHQGHQGHSGWDGGWCASREARPPPRARPGSPRTRQHPGTIPRPNIRRMTNESAEFGGLAALVTGGASGIGLATARLLAARGARVAVLDRADGIEALKAGQGSAAGEWPDLYPVVADVTDDAAVRAAVAEAGRALGRLDIVVNNAGIGAAGTVEDNDDAEWHRVLDVNVLGTVRTTRAALPLLRQAARERGQAAIVNTCSIAAIAGLPQRALYSATKGAVYSLTLAMAADHVAEGIRVNCVTPGTADTPWVGRLLDAAPDPAAERAALNARQPIGRLVSADEVAAAIAYLASPLAGATTGTALAVDGGMQGLRIRPRPT